VGTIYALATAQGKAGVAVVRVSGPAAHSAVARLAGPVPAPRRAALRRLHGVDGGLIDQALVLVFAEGESFTGEAVAEFHLHGSPAVTQAVLRELSTLPGLRPAEAGEFTRRALENERLDLAQVEGLADLIDAETEAQRRQAMRVFSGKLGKLAEQWRARLLRAMALLEASIDFADEDVPTDVVPEVRELVQGLIADFEGEVAGARVAERIRDGFEVAIVGAPNVGKSTLLNAIAGREAAITSQLAGTTRDVIEVRMDLGGLPVTFLDTAGLRDTADEIEGLGIARARARAAAADMRVFLVGPGEAPMLAPEEGDLVVGAKADLGMATGLCVSGLTGEGLGPLLDAVEARLVTLSGAVQTAIRERHRIALTDAVLRLRSVLALLEAGEAQADIASEEMRSALAELDSLVGRVNIEQVLGEIFASFCIGK